MLALTLGGASGVGHNGSNVGWKTMIRCVPTTGTGVAILTRGDSVATASKVHEAWKNAAPGL